MEGGTRKQVNNAVIESVQGQGQSSVMTKNLVKAMIGTRYSWYVSISG